MPLSGLAIRIMLVDDDPFMLGIIDKQLNALGLAVSSAHASGANALAALESSTTLVDLIMLDLNMPEMDGLEFVRHLVARAYAGSIILISGEDERMLQAASALILAHRITLLGFLHKPFKLETLQAMFGKWTPVPKDRRHLPRNAYGADAVQAAIENGELFNFYQPMVDPADGRVLGVETLVRWRHPVDGLVFPDQFIQIAEAHGLISSITRVVIREALAQAQKWRAAGLGLRVSINISMDDLTNLDFVDSCVNQCALFGVQTSDVTFELTESRVLVDLRTTLEVLTRLRLKRFMLSIDDFGTGHSSLKQLHDFPFDELKIDRGFVHRAWEDETLRAIFDASRQLARQLAIGVVAEGVEDAQDWTFVQRAGCDVVQGYFIARPMPASDIPDWIARWGNRVDELLSGVPRDD